MELNDSTSTWANVQRVNNEPHVSVDDCEEQRGGVLEHSDDEKHDENAMNDEITEHLARVALQGWRKIENYVYKELDSSTYALNSQQ